MEKEMVKINVQLYESENRHVVWGDRLEGHLHELNDIKDNLLKSMVTVVQQQIDQDLLSKIRQRPLKKMQIPGLPAVFTFALPVRQDWI